MTPEVAIDFLTGCWFVGVASGLLVRFLRVRG